MLVPARLGDPEVWTAVQLLLRCRHCIVIGFSKYFGCLQRKILIYFEVHRC
jgi:hypothetical protein